MLVPWSGESATPIEALAPLYLRALFGMPLDKAVADGLVERLLK